jgi:transcriptional regulator with XRE-family HTH domain
MGTRKNLSDDGLSSGPAGSGDLRTLIGRKIKAAREEKALNQDNLGLKVGVTGAMIGKYERWEDNPGPGVVVALAAALNADPRLWLLYSELQRVARGTDESKIIDDPAIRVLQGWVEELEQERGGTPEQASLSGKTLADFPYAFDGPFWIVVGDRRESRGRKMTPADFGALSASPADLRYLNNLGLKRRDFQIISDKVFVLAPLDELRQRFANATLIVLGSPASNHAARIINRYSLHRFNLPHTYYDELEALIQEAWKIGAGPDKPDRPSTTDAGLKANATAGHNSADDTGESGDNDSETSTQPTKTAQPAKPSVDFFTAPEAVPGQDFWDYESLEKLVALRIRELNWQRHTLFNGGLIDPAFKSLIRGMDNSPDRDFGIVTLASNPFRDPDKPDGKFPALFLAGYHLPATCYALHESIWGDRRTFFKNHPFGGVTRVNLKPAAAAKKRSYTYYERMESFSAAWDDESDYTPADLLSALKLLSESQRANFTKKEAGRAHKFLERLMQG